MGWTSHLDAILKPNYDIELNIKSHIHLMNSLNNSSNLKVIYLGSRSQYGHQLNDIILEDDKLDPKDIQGVSKTATELYYKVYSKLFGFNICSVRLPACFGKNQKTEGRDVGLIGQLIIKSLKNEKIEIFGNNRKRNIIYVDDLVEIVYRLSQKNIKGFKPVNIKGSSIVINKLARKIVQITKKGKIVNKNIPCNIKSIDIGNSEMSEKELVNLIGPISYTGLGKSLVDTINYFKEKIK